MKKLNDKLTVKKLRKITEKGGRAYRVNTLAEVYEIMKLNAKAGMGNIGVQTDNKDVDKWQATLNKSGFGTHVTENFDHDSDRPRYELEVYW